MKVLLYSHVFHPSIGGVETVSMELAEGFTKSGILCKVITRTPQAPGTKFGFESSPTRTRAASTIDGADWWNGAPGPMPPWASVRHHAKLNFKGAVKDGLKLALRRFVAKRLVTRNVAIMKWMEEANPLPHQVHIYDPFPVGRFAARSTSEIIGPGTP